MSDDWGMKVTKDTKSVTSTDKRDYSVHTEDFLNILRIETGGAGTIDLNDLRFNIQTLTIAHGFGYIPYFKFFGYFSGAHSTNLFDITCPSEIIDSAGNPSVYVFPVIDATNLVVTFYHALFTPANNILHYHSYFGRDQLV